MAIVLYLCIYIALLAAHTNQKLFQRKRPGVKRTRERREALGSPMSKVDRVEGRSWFAWKEGVGYVIQTLYKSRIIPRKLIQTFRMFIDELCHDFVGSHRRAPVPMSRRTSAGDEARLYNDPNSPLHLPKRVEGATRSNRCVVCSEKYKQSKRVNPAAKDRDLPKRAKTVYWGKSCEVFLCIASDNENCFELYHSKVSFWR